MGFPLDEEDIEELCSHLPIDGKHFKYPVSCKDFFYFSVEISEVYLLISWKKPEAYREQILKNRDILLKKKNLFIWLCWVLVVAGRIFSCGVQDLVLTRNGTVDLLHWELRVSVTRPPEKFQQRCF